MIDPKIRKDLIDMASNAYCLFIDIMKRAECCGFDQKIKEGLFEKKNLNSFMNAYELLGRHRAIHDVIKLLEGK